MEKGLKCDLCSEELDSVDKLNAHIKHHHEGIRENKKKTFECNMCGYECTKNSHLVYHMRTHTGERPFKCQVGDCGSAFKVEKTLREHMKHKHSDERPLKCDFLGCLHTSKFSSDLRKHKKIHSDERPFACPHSGCNYRAKRKNHISKHAANVHSESKTFHYSKCKYSTTIASTSMEGCEVKGTTSRAAKDHIRRHKTRLPCPVSGCGRYAPTKEALKNHSKTHSPSGRPFQCPLCFNHYPTLKRLQRHCFVHTNEKPFQCGHCEYEAAMKVSVKHHMSAMHPTVQFPFIKHLLDDRECLSCKVTLPSVEFIHHCKSHVGPAEKM